MKKLIPFFFILIGCGSAPFNLVSNDNEVTITKEEYKKLTGDTIKPEYPKPFKLLSEGNSESRIVSGSDGHEYIEFNWNSSSYNILHSPECIKCNGIDTSKITS